MGPRPHLSLCACKTTRLTSELLVSIGPSPHLWFLHAKLRLYDQNYKSLLVPQLIYGFLHSKQRLYPQNCIHYWSQPSSMVFACKTASLAPELLVSMGPSPHLLFFFAFTTASL